MTTVGRTLHCWEPTLPQTHAHGPCTVLYVCVGCCVGPHSPNALGVGSLGHGVFACGYIVILFIHTGRTHSRRPAVEGDVDALVCVVQDRRRGCRRTHRHRGCKGQDRNVKRTAQAPRDAPCREGSGKGLWAIRRADTLITLSHNITSSLCQTPPNRSVGTGGLRPARSRRNGQSPTRYNGTTQHANSKHAPTPRLASRALARLRTVVRPNT